MSKRSDMYGVTWSPESMSSFIKMLNRKWDEGKFVCVGLDSDAVKINRDSVEFGSEMRDVPLMYCFNIAIINATKDIVCAFKPNIAFYEAHGSDGWFALRDTIRHIRNVAPDVPIILDAKRADIGNTNNGYVKAAFDLLDADAITVSPYFGKEALMPFLEQKNKGVIVLCRTSNPGAGEFQDLPLIAADPPNRSMPLYQYVAHRVARFWNDNNNCALVVGATYPKELEEVRAIVGDDMPILIPGIGTQGGDIEKTVHAGKDKNGRGMIINSSGGIIFASKKPDFADVARQKTLELQGAITSFL